MERSAHAGARFQHRLRRVLPWAALGLAVVGAAGCRAPDDRVVVVKQDLDDVVPAGRLGEGAVDQDNRGLHDVVGLSTWAA